MLTGSSFDDAALFMDELFPLKEEDAVTSQAAAATTMDADMFPASSLELVQLLAYDDVGDDAFLDGPFAMNNDAVYSPSASDDLSDAMTDAASEMSSPPPSFEDDRQLTPVSPSDYATYTQTTTPSHSHSHSHSHSSGGSSTTRTPRPLAKPQSAPVSPPPAVAPTQPQAPLSVPTASMLPFAFPVACFPPMSLSQKRPLPDVLPNTPTESDPSLSKKSKREIRQMKNRESANRSRLRRKAQLSDLSSEVDDLMKKQHELQNTIAALQAENKSLHDQNSFLRSLVTMSRGVTLPPVPSFTAQDMAPLSRPVMKSSLTDLESGNHSGFQDEDDEEDEDEDEEVAMLVSTTKKRKTFSRTAASVSATGLGLCASVFGLTILADSENSAAQSSHIRRSGRVLHSLPSTVANPGCSPGVVQSMMERVWEVLSSSWATVSSSELAYGVFLNVLSFVIIMGLYHCFTQYVSSQESNKKAFRWSSVKSSKRATANAATNAKRRSVSWQDVRLQSAAQEEASMPRVQVFT